MMTSPTASLDDTSTWAQWGHPDAEFQKMMADNVPRRFPPVDLSKLGSVREAWADLCRSDMKAMLEKVEDTVACEEIHIPLRDNTSTRAWVFRPVAKGPPTDEGKPLVVLIHGGGFLFGVAEMEAAACIAATQTYGCVSVSLSYRLSPEVKFPVAYNDCWDALQWIAAHAAQLGADPSKGFVLGGTSSGGQTTAALSHWARDTSLSPPLTGLYLNVPATVPEPSAVPDVYKSIYQSRSQNNPSTASGKGDESGKAGLSEKTQSAFELAVQPDKHSDLWNPLNWHNGHRGLPRTYFQVCGADILRDDALIYERVLRLECGVETKLDIYPGLPHVFWYLYPTHSACARFYHDTTRGLGWLLRKSD